MTWFTEDPMPLVAIGSVGALLLLVGFLASRNARFLFAAVAVGVLVVAAVITERMIVTEREQVEAAVWRLSEAVEGNDLQRVLDSISPSADHLKQAARAALPQVRVTSVNVSGLEVEVPGTSTPRIGTANFRATVQFSAQGFENQPSYFAWELTFRLEGEEWLLFDAVRRMPVGNPRELPLIPKGY